MGPNVGSDYARSSSTLETSPSVDHHQTTAAEAVVSFSAVAAANDDVAPCLTSPSPAEHQHDVTFSAY